MRVEASTAEERVGAAIAAGEVVAGSVPTVELEETTSPDLWAAMAAQTFRVKEGLYSHESFAVTGADVVQLGSGYQGPGIIDHQLVRLDADNEPDFAFVTGSGERMKRYNVGILDRPGYVPPDPAAPDPATLPATAPLRVRSVDFTYRDRVELRDNAGEVEIWDPARRVLLGRLTGSGDRLRFEPEPDLPRYVRQRFLSPSL